MSNKDTSKRPFSLDVKATALRFDWRGRTLIAYAPGCEPEDVRYGDFDVADTVINAGDWGKWWIVYVEDCFSPPMAVVCADSPSDAEERFISEVHWADVPEEDLVDYVPEEDTQNGQVVRWDNMSEYIRSTDRGTFADTEAIMISEIRLVGVDLAE